MMYQFKGILQNDGWLTPGYIHLNDAGEIQSISDQPEEGLNYTNVNGYAIPGLQNAHSHAFQYAMIGITEHHDKSKSQDDFWGWRNAMYTIALHIDPDQMEAIATMLYTDMLKHGLTHVAEFHYVHHPKNGDKYENVSELGERLVLAAKQAGIKITLIPIFYQKGGFDMKPTTGQKRFISKNIEEYDQLFSASEKSIVLYEDASIAYGAHSLRAVEPEIIKELRADVGDKFPFHMHVSEQKKEIEQSISYLGKRPVEWSLENLNLNENCNLVHATHMSSTEIKDLAVSQANVVLCPTTEGNLADGLFSFLDYQKDNGRWSIGTDSQIGINPFQDLRFLDYGQRVKYNKRDVFADYKQFDSGLNGIKKVVLNGRRANGIDQKDFFTIGTSFDALVLNANSPLLSVCSPENLCSTIVYGSDVSMHLGTIVNGKWLIENGKHHNQIKIEEDFSKTLKQINCR